MVLAMLISMNGTHKIIGCVCILSASLMVMGCDAEESRPSYDVIENIIKPSEEIRIEWSENSGLLNINQIESSLSREEREVFSKSLEWLGTESLVPLSILSNKTASQTVDLVNCIKENVGKPIEICNDDW